MYIYLYLHIHMYMHNIYTCIYTYKYICVYICTCVYIHIYIYVYLYMYIYTLRAVMRAYNDFSWFFRFVTIFAMCKYLTFMFACVRVYVYTVQMAGILPQHNVWRGDMSDPKNYHNLVRSPRSVSQCVAVLQGVKRALGHSKSICI